MITISEKGAMVEQFDELILVSSDKIITSSKNKRTIVEGQGLLIRVFSEDEIVIAGQIKLVKFDEK